MQCYNFSTLAVLLLPFGGFQTIPPKDSEKIYVFFAIHRDHYFQLIQKIDQLSM